MTNLRKSYQGITIVYFLLLTMVFPYYIRDGYKDIGQAKYLFFLYITLGFLGACILLIISLVKGEYKEADRQWMAETVKPSFPAFTDARLYFLAYVGICFISLYMSSYRETAWSGTHSWKMGLLTQLMLLAVFWFAERIHFPKVAGMPIIIWMGMIGSIGVFLLAVLNRFSIYPIEMESADATFISTLGNINWFCGYWLIFASLGVGLFMISKHVWLTLLLAIYSYLAILTGILQGSSSAVLVYGVWSLLLLWFVFEEKLYLERTLLLGTISGLAILTIRLLYLFKPAGMQFESDIIDLFQKQARYGMQVTTLFLLAALAVHFLLPEYAGQKAKEFRAYFFALVGGLMITLALLFVINSMVPGGVWPVRDINFFYFSDLWGNGRGGIWKNTMMALKDMNFRQLLFGVGPDCYGEFVREQPEITRRLVEQFGQIHVSNAHNEWLNELVNVGAIGLFFYLAGFVVCIRKCAQKVSRKNEFLPFLICILAYMVHQMVSFRQILSAPFIFMVLGLAEGLTKEDDSHTINQ